MGLRVYGLTWQVHTVPSASETPLVPPRSRRGFLLENECEGTLLGTAMLTAERCRVRAAECQRMAAQAPNARVQDILIDMARTWMRLALEAEQWTQMNRPSTRLTKAAPKNAAGEPIKLTLPSRVSRRETP